MRQLVITVLLLAASWLGGCSTQQWYAAGQQWQRKECGRIDDREERRRCEQSAERSYDSYRAQAEAARKP